MNSTHSRTSGTAKSVAAALLLIFAVSSQTIPSFAFSESAVPTKAKAQEEQRNKVLVRTFNPPIEWRHETVDLSVRQDGGAVALGLSNNLEPFTLTSDIQRFLGERGLSASGEGVRIASDRGELVGRLLNADASQTVESGERQIRFLAYGHVDQKDYAFVYEFAYDAQAKRLLRGKATNLQGDGYEVDYSAGQAFKISGGGGDVGAAVTQADIQCILDNLTSCSTFVDLVLCVITLGTSCLRDFLRAILIDLACGISVTCQPLGGGQRADLVVTALSCPSTGTPGGQINISVTARNQGNAAAAAFRLGFYFSTNDTITSGDTYSGAACNVPGLPAGGSTTCGGSITVPNNLAAGTYYFGALADDLGVVSESNELNNGRAAGPITISSGTSTLLDVSSSVTAGQERRYQFTVPSGKSLLRVEMTGTNDADLYVRRSSQPTVSLWDCRPYLANSNETCQFPSPASGTWFVMVRGFSAAASSYRLRVTLN